MNKEQLYDNLPKDWIVKRLKFIANEENSLFLDGDWIESSMITDNGIMYLTTGNIGDLHYKEKNNQFISEDTFNELNCLKVFPNDLVLSRLNSPISRACLLPNIAPYYVVAVDDCVLRPNKDISKKFMLYQLNSYGYRETAENLARGTTMQRVSRSQLGKLNVVVPPLKEQNLIAQYLDEKVPQIEKVIDVIKKEIEVLEMTKKSIITECVTKGLDKDIELKDSGVEILGLINKTYEIKKIKYVSILKTGTTPEQKIGISDEKTINNIKWHTPGDFNGFELNASQYIDNNNNLFFPENSIYLVTIGATLGKIAIEPEKSYCNQQITVLMPKINNKYLMYNLYSNVDYLRMNSESTTLAQLNNQTLKNIKICVASLKEQQEIVDYLDKKCGAIDKIIATKKEQISKLETHKQSLIYDYVTGKKRVKGVE